MRIWLRFAGGEDRLARGTIAKILAGRRIITEDSSNADSGEAGLLFFDRVSSELFHLVRTASLYGARRLLAVAVPGAVLDAADSWRLLEAGASDVFAWERVADPGAEIAARLERWEAVEERMHLPLVTENLLGESPVWRSILARIVEVGAFTDASVLIMGETGTGKELAARMIHALDPRPTKGGFVVLDCTTIVPTLSGSEFFGHEKGAFTGAVSARDGAFALADGGTLFLDEIGELPLPLQAELLRVVEEGMYKRVGSNTWRRTTFRLLCATNRDLIEEASVGRFRRDLYYRISTWTFRLPTLRERAEDLPVLARHFLKQSRPEGGPDSLDDAVMGFLQGRDYPGNVRELKQLVVRMASRHAGTGPLTVGDVPREERPAAARDSSRWWDGEFERCIRRALAKGARLREIRGVAAETAIRLAVAEEQGNLQRAARRLGVTDRALQMRRAERGGPGEREPEGPTSRS